MVYENTIFNSLNGNEAAFNRVVGKQQVFVKTVTSVANAGNVTLATVTSQSCIIDSIIIRAIAAQTADLNTCAITGGAAGVISFIPIGVATQANLNATDKQVNSLSTIGEAELPATSTIVMNLLGGGATPVNLMVTIIYKAAVNGGYLV